MWKKVLRREKDVGRDPGRMVTSRDKGRASRRVSPMVTKDLVVGHGVHNLMPSQYIVVLNECIMFEETIFTSPMIILQHMCQGSYSQEKQLGSVSFSVALH